jgi:hypothetical protein
MNTCTKQQGLSLIADTDDLKWDRGSDRLFAANVRTDTARLSGQTSRENTIDIPNKHRGMFP